MALMYEPLFRAKFPGEAITEHAQKAKKLVSRSGVVGRGSSVGGCRSGVVSRHPPPIIHLAQVEFKEYIDKLKDLKHLTDDQARAAKAVVDAEVEVFKRPTEKRADDKKAHKGARYAILGDNGKLVIADRFKRAGFGVTEALMKKAGCPPPPGSPPRADLSHSQRKRRKSESDVNGDSDGDSDEVRAGAGAYVSGLARVR